MNRRYLFSKLITAFLSLLFNYEINAQALVGKIINFKTKEPVLFAAIGITDKNVGGVTDENGIFKIKYALFSWGDVLKISAIGFENKLIPLETINQDDTLIINLNENIYSLPLAEVNGNKAGLMVKDMINRLPYNFSDTTFYSDATYFQYHKENGRYVRLIIADVCIATEAVLKDKALAANESVAVRTKLRSKNEERNSEEHGDHLMDLIKENPVYHPESSPLNIKAYAVYNFVWDTTYADTNTCRILFYNTDVHAAKNERGALVIDLKSKALISFSKEETYNSASIKNNNPMGSAAYTWIFIKSKTEFNFFKRDSLWYPLSFYKTYTHKLIDNKVKSTAYMVEENFELNYENHFSSSPVLSKPFSEFSNLYTGKLAANAPLAIKFQNAQFHFGNKDEMLQDITEWDAVW